MILTLIWSGVSPDLASLTFMMFLPPISLTVHIKTAMLAQSLFRWIRLPSSKS